MTLAVLALVARAWAVAAGLQLVLWVIQQRTKNAGIVDVGWAFAFTPVVAVFAWSSDAPIEAWAPIAAIVTAWSVRLTAYLVARGAATGPEEGRYVDLRRRWSPHASRAFFVFFQAQAALVAILSTAFVVPFVAAPDHLVPRIAGAALAVVGILGETLADAQLAAWKRDPANRGKVCDIGLWAWSRHPNYFFEWCVWIGHAVYGLAFLSSGGWLALGAQAVILASIWKVTGIPATEAQALRSKGDAYRDYQGRVSMFLLRPPKHTRRIP